MNIYILTAISDNCHLLQANLREDEDHFGVVSFVDLARRSLLGTAHMAANLAARFSVLVGSPLELASQPPTDEASEPAAAPPFAPPFVAPVTLTVPEAPVPS